MPQLETVVVNRQELRKVLITFGVSEKALQSILSSIEKAHRHVNVIVFSSLLEKAGLDVDKRTNVFRRLGLDDITIRNIINVADEQKLLAETGRVFSATIDFS